MDALVCRVGKQRAGDDVVGCGAVAAEHDIFHAGQAGQCFHVCVVGLQGHRVCEEEEIVDFSFHDARTDLLVTSERA